MSAESHPPTHRAFDGLATTYANYRPSYPSLLFTTMLEGLPRPVRAVDLGCGTGISTRLLAAAGAETIGIDPGRDMLATARRTGPDTIHYREGTAEETGLADASCDLVLAAQAFHWFDAARALVEIRRILRPQGRLALLWNVRVADGGFTDAYGRVVAAAAERIDPTLRSARAALDAALEATEGFRIIARVEAENPQSLDEAGTIGRATSASYCPRQEPERTRTMAALRSAFRQYAVDGRVVLRQEAKLTLAESA